MPRSSRPLAGPFFTLATLASALAPLGAGCEGRVTGAIDDPMSCPECVDADAAVVVGADAGMAPSAEDGGGAPVPSDAGVPDVDGGEVAPGDAGPPATLDAGPPPIVDDRPSSERHVTRPVGTTAAALGYWEYLPPGYGDGVPRPLLVFLHGIGENGAGTEADLARVPNGGPPQLIERDAWPNDRPFVVLSPQHPGGGCPSPSEIHDFFTYAMDAYDVDPARIYLTGLSCGAIGSWNYIGTYLDEQIVAMVAIAGDGRGAWSRQGCDLGAVDIWAFHGDADPTVSPDGTIVPTTNLMSCPVPPRHDLEVTIYPGVGHNSWSRTYDLSAGHDVYAWLLSHHR